MRDEWLSRALTFEAYLDKADLNVPTMKENYNDTKFTPDDDAYFGSLAPRLGRGAISILGFSEPWCGDCVENLPVIAKMASLYPVFSLYVFPRDLSLDIMDECVGEGVRTIPVFVLFDEKGSEIGRFVERPPGAHAFMDEAKRKVADLSPEEQKRGMYKARADLRRLYREGLRNESVALIRKIVEGRYGS